MLVLVVSLAIVTNYSALGPVAHDTISARGLVLSFASLARSFDWPRRWIHCEPDVFCISVLVVSIALYTRIGSNRGRTRSTIMQCTQNIHTHSKQCAYSVVPACVPASLVLLLMPMVLYAWCYIVLLLSM